MNFVHIGDRLINLDQVSFVEYLGGSARVYLTHATGSGVGDDWQIDTAWFRLSGNDAAQLRAILEHNRLHGPKCQTGGCYAEATSFDGARARCAEHAQAVTHDPEPAGE